MRLRGDLERSFKICHTLFMPKTSLSSTSNFHVHHTISTSRMISAISVPMRKLAAALFAVLCMGTSTHAEDWISTLTPPTPGTFPPPKAHQAQYRFGWSAIHAAKATTDVSRTSKQASIQLTIATQGAVRKLWQLNATHKATCNLTSLLPSTCTQSETYKSDAVTTTLIFSPSGVDRSRVHVPPEKTDKKVKRFKFNPVRDFFSSYLFVRSQTLQDGQTIRLCIYASTDPYLAEIEVKGREKLKVGGKTYAAIRCDLRLKQIEKDMTLRAHSKFKRATAWISDDADRHLLKVESEVMVGRVWMEMDAIKPTKP